MSYVKPKIFVGTTYMTDYQQAKLEVVGLSLICPLCNGLYIKELYCPQCGDDMTDSGVLEGFFEPYRPYLDQSILQQNDGVTNYQCLHLFSCLHCGYDQRHIVNKIDNC